MATGDLATLDLATLDDVKAWFSPPLTGSADDALLARLITSASGFIAAWLNRPVGLATYTQSFNGNGRAALALPCYPITAVTALTIDGRAVAARAADGCGAGYSFDANTLYVSGDLFRPGILNVTVTWTAGYAVIPTEIVQACVDLVALRYKERDRIGLISKAMAGETTSYTQRDLPANAAAALQQYRRVAPL